MTANLSDRDILILNAALKASDNANYIALGKASTVDTLGADPPSLEQLKEKGIKTFSELSETIKKAVCNPKFIKEVEEIDKDDKGQAAIAVAEILAGYMGLPSAIYVSILTLRHGLKKMCADIEND